MSDIPHSFDLRGEERERVYSLAKFILLRVLLFIQHSSQSFILRGQRKRITRFIKQVTPINWIADITIKIAIK